ncbi:ABC transporter ATP-binding protein [Chitinasiproducens palmae]|uniref:Putative ABC transport system ATP-binding protein n=1 Tax=Chitinasiproducens palmae TaxID=1770053 RepID=A0A1H2PVU5_9BURK|nr:ABC transporter ATP-binding protein [Chitinasiproducens palmae]SDV51471.1 putative ABC transport system ATP-binding protein [Chitinasiproducens palmae]
MRSDSKAVIEVAGLTKRADSGGQSLLILDDVSLTVAAGETVAIVGESGSGKSTLLGLLAGLDRASAGTVHVFGQELGALDEERRAALRNGRIGFVFQSFQLMPHLNALENVMLPLELAPAGHGVASARPRERALQLLERVGLAQRANHYPRVLSGGEQQRVALARAFVTGPQLVFADEPTGSLDAANGQLVSDLMFEMNRQSGATFVLVTHDLVLARRCDRVVTLAAGRVVAPVTAV